MGDEFYGVWSVLYSIMLFAGIGAVGISSIVNKFAAEAQEDKYPEHCAEIITASTFIIIPMATLTAGVLWMASRFIASHMQLNIIMQAQFTWALRICAIGIFPQFLAKIPQGYLLSQYRNKIVRSLDFSVTILPWMGAVLISLVEKNIIWIACWFVCIQIIHMATYYLLIRKEINWKQTPNFGIMRKLVNFSAFMLIESTAIAMFQLLDRVLVSFILGPAAAGVYSVGTSVGVRMSLIAGQITEIMIPYASRTDSLGQEGRLLVVFRKMSRFVSLIIMGIGSILILWMPEILRIWISQEYAHQNSTIFQIIVLAYCYISLSRPGHQTLTGLGKVKWTSSIYLGSAVLMLACLTYLTRSAGAIGAAAANLVMATLLTFNLLAYQLLGKKIIAKQVINDLGWGIFPLLAITLASLLPYHLATTNKLTLTILMSLGIITLIVNDDYIKKSIASIVSFEQRA